MEGMLFLAPGGMSTRRSGLRLFMPKFMGGGDFACMFLFIPAGDTSRPGELRWFPYPFPEGAKNTGSDFCICLFVCWQINSKSSEQIKI